MAFVNEVLEEISKFLEESEKLLDSLEEDYETDEGDWDNMLRMREKLFCISSEVLSITDFYILLHYVEYQSEKDKFEAQKIIVRNFKKFIDSIDVMINVGRLWKYKDYRCIDWIKRLTEFMVEIKDGFEEMFQMQG